MKEILKYYNINEDGSVYSKRTKKYLKPTKTPNGYLRMTLQAKGDRVDILLHRLVAALFIPNPDNKPQVNHKDRDKYNNHKNNLEWVTQSENALHTFKTTPPVNSNLNGRLNGEGNGNHKLSEREVRAIRKLSKTRRRAEPLWEYFDISRQMYYNIINESNWVHI